MNQNQPAWIPTDTSDGTTLSVTSSLRREFEILFRRRRLILGLIGLCLFVAALYNYGARPIYEAVAVVSLDEAGVSPLSTRRASEPARLAVALDDQARLLKSPELVLAALSNVSPALADELANGPLGDWKDRVVEEVRFRLGFPRKHGTELPDFVAAFVSRLTITYRPPSIWVYVRFQGYDPAATAQAVDTFLAAYMAEAERRTAGAEGASREKIDEALSEGQGQVVETFGKLKQFETKAGLDSIDASRDLLDKEMASLQEALIGARETSLTRRNRLEEIQAVSPAEMLSLPSVRQDREVAEATTRIAELEARLAVDGSTLGERHPDIVRLRLDLDLARKRLSSRLSAIREAASQDLKSATRDEKAIRQRLASTRKKISRLQGTAVEQSFIQQRAEAGQRAVGALIEKSVREADQEVFFAPRVLQRPALPSSAVSPQRARNFQYAFALGLFLGLSAAWLMAHLDESIKTPEDVKAGIGARLLGVVPKMPPAEFDVFAEEDGDENRVAEIYRVLRTNLVMGEEASEACQVILLTSSREAEGKTTTSCGIGVALARGGQRVLLVDADLRRATLTRRLSAVGQWGVGDAVGGADVSKCIVSTPVPGLSLMPSGTPRRVPAEVLNGPGLKQIIDSLRPSYDWILCDAPPVLAIADATILCRLTDSVILVIGANATPLGSIRATMEQLADVSARVRGVVLNRVDLDRDSHYYKYYYASHYASYSGKPGKKQRKSRSLGKVTEA